MAAPAVSSYTQYLVPLITPRSESTFQLLSSKVETYVHETQFNELAIINSIINTHCTRSSKRGLWSADGSTDDFGTELQTLRFSSLPKEKLANSMIGIAALEGFELELPHSSEKSTPIAPQELFLSFLGRRLFTLSNMFGNKTILLGENHLQTIHCECLAAGLFDADGIGEIPQEEVDLILKNLQQPLLENTVVEIFSLGLLPAKTGEDLALYKPMVARYLAQRQLILRVLSIKLDIPLKSIHLIDETVSHLDNLIMPGPHKTVFVQDYSLCARILTSLKNEALSFEFTQDDQDTLDQYIVTANKLQKNVGPYLRMAYHNIQRANFLALPTPGHFADNINFLSNISGWSAKNKRPFVVTRGAKVSSRLGASLMKVFECFMKHYEQSTKVHFTPYSNRSLRNMTSSVKTTSHTYIKSV